MNRAIRKYGNDLLNLRNSVYYWLIFPRHCKEEGIVIVTAVELKTFIVEYRIKILLFACVINKILDKQLSYVKAAVNELQRGYEV